MRWQCCVPTGARFQTNFTATGLPTTTLSWLLRLSAIGNYHSTETNFRCKEDFVTFFKIFILPVLSLELLGAVGNLVRRCCRSGSQATWRHWRVSEGGQTVSPEVVFLQVCTPRKVLSKAPSPHIQTHTTYNPSLRLDEELALEKSAFQIFHSGNSTFINSFDKAKNFRCPSQLCVVPNFCFTSLSRRRFVFFRN